MWDRQTLSCRPFRYRPVDARDPTFSSRQDPRNGHVCHFSTGYIVDSNGKRVRLKCVNWPYPWCAIRTLLKRTFHLMLHTFHTARSRLSFFFNVQLIDNWPCVSFSTPRYGAHLEQMVANGLDRVSPGSTSLWVFFSQKTPTTQQSDVFLRIHCAKDLWVWLQLTEAQVCRSNESNGVKIWIAFIWVIRVSFYFGPQIVGPPPFPTTTPIRIPLKPWGICYGKLSCFLLGVSWRHPLRIKVWDCPSAWMVWLETSRFLIRRQICRLADGWEFMGLLMMNQQEYTKKKLPESVEWCIPTKKSKNGKKIIMKSSTLVRSRGNCFFEKKKSQVSLAGCPELQETFFHMSMAPCVGCLPCRAMELLKMWGSVSFRDFWCHSECAHHIWIDGRSPQRIEFSVNLVGQRSNWKAGKQFRNLFNRDIE